MPENITIAAFVLGAVMLLISIVGGKFKIFGAEVSAMAGPISRIFAGIVGTLLLGIGLYNSLYKLDATQTEESAKPLVESSQPAKIKSVPETESSKALPATFVLGKLTCIIPQEPGGEDRVYLKLGESKPTKVWKLKAGESIQVGLTVAAGTSVTLYEKDGLLTDGDDDFLGTAKLIGRSGTLQFKIPEIGDHFYTLSYEPGG
ncbi:MAG: hypothetical protein DWQ05_19405 [Calditrichaeota bacterium]|nr:MAG: hypothetical protein DWQ05_19405 [Calditrichota bacterium]